MYHFYDTVINDSTGVPIKGVVVRVTDFFGATISIYADNNGTPIETVSGIPNAAVTDGSGMVDFYIEPGVYNLAFYIGDALLKTLADIWFGVGSGSGSTSATDYPFTATDGQLSFLLPFPPPFKPIVYVNGARQIPANVAVVGQVVTLTIEPGETMEAGSDVIISVGEGALLPYTTGDRIIDLDNYTIPLIDSFREEGDPVDDDTPALMRAALDTRYVRGKPGEIYYLGVETNLPNLNIDLTGCYVRKAPGAKYAIDFNVYHGTVVGGDFNDQYGYTTTTFAVGASAGATSVTVANAAGLEAGMHVVHPSNWEAGVEFNRIASIVGNVVTLKVPLRGDVAIGGRFLADFPMIRFAGSGQVYGSIRDCWIRACLFGLQSGDENLPGGNVFTTINNIRMSDIVGAGFIFSANHAGENISDFVINCANGQSLNYTGNGATVRFTYPYRLRPNVARWGAEPSVRVYVNGTQLNISQYTVDEATAEVVLSVAPAGGAAVYVENNENGAFGYVASSIFFTAPSSVERLANGIVIDAVVGEFLENCELGFISNVQKDSCEYAAGLWRNCSNIHARASDYMFSPFGLIMDGCNKCSVVGFTTSIKPDNAEFVITPSKKDLIIRSNCTSIMVDWLSWTSTSQVVEYYPSGLQSVGGYQFTPDSLAIGGDPSGRMMLYGKTGDGFFQLSEDAKGIYLGGSGFHYIQANGAGATLRVGSASGAVEMIGAAGVGLTLGSTGIFTMVLPTYANNAAALGGGLVAGQQYKTATGENRTVV